MFVEFGSPPPPLRRCGMIVSLLTERNPFYRQFYKHFSPNGAKTARYLNLALWGLPPQTLLSRNHFLTMQRRVQCMPTQ